MTKSSPNTPPTRRSSLRLTDQDSPKRKKKKANETQKPASTKKTKTQTRKDKSTKTPTTVFIEDDAMYILRTIDRKSVVRRI